MADRIAPMDLGLGAELDICLGLPLFAGPAAELGRRVGVVPMAITMWKRRGRVPAERCLAVEAATGVSRYALRPDVFGPAPANDAPTTPQQETAHG